MVEHAGQAWTTSGGGDLTVEHGHPAAPNGRTPRSGWLAIGLVGLLMAAAVGLRMGGATSSAGDRAVHLVTVFLGIFIEAVPFLLAGSLVSGVLEVFVGRSAIEHIVPRRPVRAAAVGSVMGLVFPVCECGVVPVTRRLFAKGLPISVGVAFLLAAPVVNPIAIASTWAAFGWSPMTFGRVGLTIAFAFAIGLLFALAAPAEVLRPDVAAELDGDPSRSASRTPGAVRPVATRVADAAVLATGDFVDMGRYMITGSLIAASLQTLLPQSVLLALGRGPVISVIALMALAFMLSVCSTVDAFLALAFVGTFSPAAVLAFLVFGPMVDLKSCLMFQAVFRRRAVVYLVLLPFLLTLVTAVWLHRTAAIANGW